MSVEIKLYWLSFVDPARPAGQRFLGACVLRAGSPKGAIIRAHWQGCNPGGEVKMYEVPPELSPELERVPRDRLLSRAALERYGVDTASVGEMRREGFEL